MNVYDQAHILAKAIKECEEYKQYMNAKNMIAQNPDLDKMIQDFQAKQLEMQAKQIAGEEMDAEAVAKMQELMTIMMQDPAAAQYVQCEMRFALMMQDVYQILNETMVPAGSGNSQGANQYLQELVYLI